MTSQEEATRLFGEVIGELTSPTPTENPKGVLRKCQHACELANWEEQKRWFHQELNGFCSGSEIPDYRRVTGRRVWRRKHLSAEYLNALVMEALKGTWSAEAGEQVADVLVIWSGVDWILAACKSGYTEATGETKVSFSEQAGRDVEWERVRIFEAVSFLSCLGHIERLAFDFASNAYVQLRYGSAIADIWSSYRLEVEQAMGRIGLADHLFTIQAGLQSDNPESWRLAVLGCRNLLKDVAEYLWKDTRPVYDHLVGAGPGGKLEVTSDKFGNRLSAYLHRKSQTGTRGRFLRTEAERLSESFSALISLQSEGHDPMDLRDARSAGIFTYCLLGELVTRTDMKPVQRW